MRPLLRELVPLFARTHDVTADIEFQLSAALKRAIQDGAVFDFAILPRPELDDLIALGAIVRDSAADVARSIVGLAVRTGAAKPDIGSVEALRRALLQARSIAYSDGPSGAYVADLLASSGSPRRSRPRSSSPAVRWPNSSRAGRPSSACSRSSPSCRLRARNWSARCRPSCKMSLSMPPACRRARPVRRRRHISSPSCVVCKQNNSCVPRA
jgi:hypothetical protein